MPVYETLVTHVATVTPPRIMAYVHDVGVLINSLFNAEIPCLRHPM